MKQRNKMKQWNEMKQWKEMKITTTTIKYKERKKPANAQSLAYEINIIQYNTYI